MEEKLTKEQIQQELPKYMSLLGQKVYTLLVPLLDIRDVVNHCAFLNSSMHKLLKEEAAEAQTKKEKPAIEVVK